jgi:type IV secretory pathway TraG/TraD family ATPase VirD4
MRLIPQILLYAGGGILGSVLLIVLLICFSNTIARQFSDIPGRITKLMSFGNLLILVFSVLAGVAAVYYGSFPPYTTLGTALVGLVVVWLSTTPQKKEEVVAELGGYTWDKNNFSRHWLITGKTGTGKTVAAIVNLQDSLFKHDPHSDAQRGWGGVCVDDKGTYWEFIQAIAEYHGRKDDLVLLQTRPQWADNNWKPPAIFNPLSDDRIPANTYADAIATCFRNAGEGGGEHAFFTNQAISNIGEGIELCRMMGRFPCLHEINDILQDLEMLKAALKKVELRLSKGEIPLDKVERAKSVISHFKGKYLNQPEEQLGGIKSTIHNYLHYFATPDVVQVFGQPDGNTVEFSDIDKGKIFCISMPQTYQIERRYVGSLLVVLYLQHAKRRFDALAEQRKNNNLLVLWSDEGHRFLSGREDVDILREAGAAIVVATQMHESFYPNMRREVADVFMGNLSNRVIFRAASSPSAEASAAFLGKKEVWKKSYSHGKGGRSVNRHKEEEYKVKPLQLLNERRFPEFTAIVYHCSKGFRRRKLKPMFVTTLKERLKEAREAKGQKQVSTKATDVVTVT